MEGDSIRVLLVGTGDDFGGELEGEGFEVTRITDLASIGPGSDQDAVIVALDQAGPLEALETLRFKAPAAAVLVLTTTDHEADGAVALHAGAEDHLVRGSIADGLLPRAIRYAVERRRLRRELATVDDLTRLPNLRGFVAIAEHHLRMADRSGNLVVFLFIRFDDHRAAMADAQPDAADQLAVGPPRAHRGGYVLRALVWRGEGCRGHRALEARRGDRRARCGEVPAATPGPLGRQRDLRPRPSGQPGRPAQDRPGRDATALIRGPMTCEYSARSSGLREGFDHELGHDAGRNAERNHELR
jgi:hypothetical protein